jgi:hypothetical protein
MTAELLTVVEETMQSTRPRCTADATTGSNRTRQWPSNER